MRVNAYLESTEFSQIPFSAFITGGGIRVFRWEGGVGVLRTINNNECYICCRDMATPVQLVLVLDPWTRSGSLLHSPEDSFLRNYLIEDFEICSETTPTIFKPVQ